MDIIALPVGSKTNIVTVHSLLGALAIPAYVIFDGDFVNAEKSKKNDTADKLSQAIASNKKQTDNCVKMLSIDDYSFGDKSKNGYSWAVCQGDLEDELEPWSDFNHYMTHVLGKRMGSKHVYAYRECARAVGVTGAPQFLTDTIASIIKWQNLTS